MIDEHQTYTVLVIGGKKPEITQLVGPLCKKMAILHTSSWEDAENMFKKNVALVIAEQGTLAQSEGDLAEKISTRPDLLWILLVEQSDSDIYQKMLSQKNVFSYVSPPWNSDEIFLLATRALEHYHLTFIHKKMSEEFAQLQEQYQTLKTREKRGGISQESSLLKPPQPRISPPSSSSGEQKALLQELHELQDTLIQSGKMMALGQMVAGIAHEINTPSGAINAAIVNMIYHIKLLMESFQNFDKQGMTREHFRQIMKLISRMLVTLDGTQRKSPSEVRAEQKKITEVLKQQDVENSRKIAKDIARMELGESIEELFLLANRYGMENILLFFTHCSRIINSAKDIKISIDILTRIIQALKSYSYPSQVKPELVDIHESIDIALILLKNKLKHQIQLEYHRGALPKIWCYPSELSHVWINIIHNAVQAIQGKGDILIETFMKKEHLGVRITDNGGGISQEVQSKIFDIHFTTKNRGEGTGLGLYIAHKIVKKHEGTIRVVSTPGKTTFEVLLPLASPF